MKLLCPNCGAETTKPICEYCGSVIQPPTTSNYKEENTDSVYILPRPKKYKTDDDLIVKCFTHLRDSKDAPVDVFSKITDVTVNRYYLPMRQFNGSVSTDWRCIQVFDRKRIVDYEYKDGKKKPIYEYYEEYIPANGKGHRHFNFLVSVATNVGLPQTLIKCLGTNPIDENITDKALPFSPSLIEDGSTIIDEASSIREKDIIRKAEKRIDREADNASFQNLSGRLKDCDYTYTWRYGSAENKRLLVPAATVSYKYKGKEYCFALVLTGESRTEYPKVEHNFIKEVENYSKKFTKTGWITFGLSLLLTITILCLWGNMTPQSLRVASIFGSILLTVIIAWKAVVISVRYDEMKKHGVELLAIKRTDNLRTSFPRYANHPAVTKISADESNAQSKINRTSSKNRSNRLLLKLFLFAQILILVAGLLNMYRIHRREKAMVITEQEKVLAQGRQESERLQAEQQRLKPVKDKILSELNGLTYTGRSLHGGSGLSVTFLDGNKISYKISPAYRDTRNCEWSIPKTVSVNLDVREVSFESKKWYKIVIHFDTYSSEEIDVHENRKLRHFTIKNDNDDMVLGEHYSLNREEEKFSLF